MNSSWFEEQNQKGKRGEAIAAEFLKEYWGAYRVDDISDQATEVDLIAYWSTTKLTFDVKYTANPLTETLPCNPTVINREKNAMYYFYICEETKTIVIVDSQALKLIPKDPKLYVEFYNSTKHSGIQNVRLSELDTYCKQNKLYYKKLTLGD